MKEPTFINNNLTCEWCHRKGLARYPDGDQKMEDGQTISAFYACGWCGWPHWLPRCIIMPLKEQSPEALQ